MCYILSFYDLKLGLTRTQNVGNTAASKCTLHAPGFKELIGIIEFQTEKDCHYHLAIIGITYFILKIFTLFTTSDFIEALQLINLFKENY